MNILLILLTILIPALELGNLYKGGNILSDEAFTLISITATIVSTIYALQIKQDKVNIILGGWILFMVVFFALGIGENLFKLISPIVNTLNLAWVFIYPILYNCFRKTG
ncbi:hypothetical protein [Clostridium perfringens]|uniref:hypothetical protein n=1 Tax=Clostridium perfringens TaxID=1502 RepID=UPI001ABA54FA|nr:hypothetical protein [Clostridium perfringens]MBO3430019.1 hypothetical protein [Clostridium perfringens]WFD90576.1 hypothetical protein P7C80_14705 [Clostridium perfringens]